MEQRPAFVEKVEIQGVRAVGHRSVDMILAIGPMHLNQRSGEVESRVRGCGQQRRLGQPNLVVREGAALLIQYGEMGRPLIGEERASGHCGTWKTTTFDAVASPVVGRQAPGVVPPFDAAEAMWGLIAR